ncbi:hypothetical protein C8Q75DRAFT_804624 [Abortiporus biennis]|nr:hypothetical protein C8Q75DRAFT_804624 [Abortiporus biennis]
MSVQSDHHTEEQVRSWGFHKVYTRFEKPNAHFKPHLHNFASTHYILSGTFIVLYPQDVLSESQVFGPGSRIDIPPFKEHEVRIGREGCKLVIGERNPATSFRD